tara:strand:- start:155 stop:679 length:525 start_codon:yes stop_codon:yes gene_type:complete
MSPSYSSQNNNVGTEHNTHETIITNEVAVVDDQNSNTHLTLEEQVGILQEENQLLRLRMEYLENMVENICQQNTIQLENCDTDLYHDNSNNESETDSESDSEPEDETETETEDESDYDSMPELVEDGDYDSMPELVEDGDYDQNQYYISNNTENLANETNIIYANSAVPYWIPN